MYNGHGGETEEENARENPPKCYSKEVTRTNVRLFVVSLCSGNVYSGSFWMINAEPQQSQGSSGLQVTIDLCSEVQMTFVQFCTEGPLFQGFTANG
jgi:hypothetical protein